MDLRLGVAPTGKQEFGHIKVLVGNNNNIVYSAKTIAELAKKVNTEKDGLIVTRLKENDDFVAIGADPQSTKTVSEKNPKEIVYVCPGSSDDLKDFWIEYAKLNQKDLSK
jgi:hypothetical protein